LRLTRSFVTLRRSLDAGVLPWPHFRSIFAVEFWPIVRPG
jgi:hypothetical protein